MKKLFLLIPVMFLFLMATGFTPEKSVTDGWDIPTKYEKMKNPYQGDKAIIPAGKMLYAKHCKSCHGSKGLGDGPKAKQLKSDCGDFSSEKFQSLNDGTLYYMSFVGKDEMPNFEKKITDEEDR